jgi:hypothetical protein
MDWNTFAQIVITIVGWEAIKKFWSTLTTGTLYRMGPKGIEMVKFPRLDKELEADLRKGGYVDWKELN